jgi:hypothetical protein
MRVIRPVTVTSLAVAVAGVAAIASASAFAAPSATQSGATNLREVCAKTAYVKQQPGSIPHNTVFRGEKLTVTRYSASRRFAHVVGPRPGFTIRGWIDVAHLCAKGTSAEFAKTSRYSVRIVNSLAGGDPGFFYVGGPANITVKDRQRAGQAVTVCMTPAPMERDSCRTGHTGQTIDSIVWSGNEPTEVRITIDGGPVLVDTVYPYPNP